MISNRNKYPTNPAQARPYFLCPHAETHNTELTSQYPTTTNIANTTPSSDISKPQRIHISNSNHSFASLSWLQFQQTSQTPKHHNTHATSLPLKPNNIGHGQKAYHTILRGVWLRKCILKSNILLRSVGGG